MSRRENPRKTRFIEEHNKLGNIIRQSETHIRFNFSYFTSGEGFGQSFEEWEKNEILADLNNKLVGVSGKTLVELLKDRTLEIYTNGYPFDSYFKKPKALELLDLKWARIRLTGRRRLIGFFFPRYLYETNKGVEKETDANLFYVVFLDKDHQFSPSGKKHT